MAGETGVSNKTMILVKLTVSPNWTLDNKITIRVVKKDEDFELICRKTAQERFQGQDDVESNPFVENIKKRRKFKQWRVFLTADAFNSLFSTLHGVNVPIIPEYQDGCDGDEWILEFNIEGHESKYSWWSTEPKGYEKLSKFSIGLLKLSNHSKIKDIE